MTDNSNSNSGLGGAKLWQKSVRVADEIDRFTVGNDRELDLLLAPTTYSAPWPTSPCSTASAS